MYMRRCNYCLRDIVTTASIIIISFQGICGCISRSITNTHEKAKPINTKKAYQPKITDF